MFRAGAMLFLFVLLEATTRDDETHTRAHAHTQTEV